MKPFVPGLLASAILLSSVLCAQTTPPPTVPAPAKPPAAGSKQDDDAVNDRWSIGAFYWLNQGTAKIIAGSASTNAAAQTLPLGDANKRAPGIMITTPAGKYNRLEISVFEAKGNGNTVAPVDLSFAGNSYPKGDLMATQFRIRTAKVSWNYLTYPSPPQNAKFRFKTLWEVQYVAARSTLDAPLDNNTFRSTVSRTVVLPTVGAGIELVPSKFVRFEIRGSGMGFPNKSIIWDAQASVVVRVKHAEILAGAKAFHFRSPPNKDMYIQSTMMGPFGGVRWIF